MTGLPERLLEIARALAPFSIHAPNEPLMRLELVPIQE
jgi:hypothetical protein